MSKPLEGSDKFEYYIECDDPALNNITIGESAANLQTSMGEFMAWVEVIMMTFSLTILPSS